MHQRSNKEKGAVAVEFAFTLLFLFLFVTAYVALTMIFIGHERLSFASFASGRILATKGNGPAETTANNIENNITISIGDDFISLQKTLKLPLDFSDVYTRGSHDFTIKKTTKVWREKDFGGDN